MPEDNKIPAEPSDGAQAQDAQLPRDEARDAMGFEIVDDSKIAHLDFLTALVLIAISTAVVITSIGYWQRQKLPFYESAGFMPVLIACGLLVMAARLLKESLKHDSARNFVLRLRKSAGLTLRSNRVHRSLFGLLVFGVYVFFLLGRMTFWLSSFLALAIVLVFVRFDGKWQTALKMLLIAALCVAGIVGLFQYAFSVPMP